MLFNDDISSIDNSVITTNNDTPDQARLSVALDEEGHLDRDMDSILDASLAILEVEISETQFNINVLKMTVMWSMSSFGLYLLNYLNKYLEGSIYEVNYSEGLAGSLAIVIGA